MDTTDSNWTDPRFGYNPHLPRGFRSGPRRARPRWSFGPRLRTLQAKLQRLIPPMRPLPPVRANA